MPKKEDVLRDETFKGDVDEVKRRVFYTLTKTEESQPQMKESLARRNSKAIALIVEILHAKEIINDDELDELLLEIVP